MPPLSAPSKIGIRLLAQTEQAFRVIDCSSRRSKATPGGVTVTFCIFKLWSTTAASDMCFAPQLHVIMLRHLALAHDIAGLMNHVQDVLLHLSDFWGLMSCLK